MVEYVVIGVSGTTKTINQLKPRADGRYIVIHPSVPSQERHHEKNYTWCNTIEEAVEKIKSGYHARLVNVDKRQEKQAEDVIIHNHIKIWEFK